MPTEASQLKTLLKHADSLQDLVYDYQELERKRKEAIQVDFSVKKSIAEYKYFKGLEAKSFIIFQVITALLTTLLFISFIDFFDRQILSLMSSIILATGINIAFVLIYKPYKVEEWYLTGFIYYGLMLAGFGMFLFGYLSVVFFLDTGSYILMLLALLNIHLVISLVFGAIFPLTFQHLDDKAIKNPLLTSSIEALEKSRDLEINEMSKDLKALDDQIQKTQKELSAMTLVPPTYKGTKTLKILIQLFEDKRATSIDEALKIYDLEEQDALRQMSMIKVK